MPTRTSQTPPSTMAWQAVAAASVSVPYQLPGARTASRPGRSADTPGRRSSTVASTGSKARASRSGLAGSRTQLGAPGLGVAAALATAYALGAGGAVADLDDVGGQHGGGGAERPVGLLERGDHRPVGAPDHHHPHRALTRSLGCRGRPRRGPVHPRPRQVGACGGRAPRWTAMLGPALDQRPGPRRAEPGRRPRRSAVRLPAATRRGPPAPRSVSAAASRGCPRPARHGGGRTQHHHPEHVDQGRSHLEPVLARVGHQHRAGELDAQLGGGLRAEVGAAREADPLPAREAPAASASASEAESTAYVAPACIGTRSVSPGRVGTGSPAGLSLHRRDPRRSCSTTDSLGSRAAMERADDISPSSNRCSNASSGGAPPSTRRRPMPVTRGFSRRRPEPRGPVASRTVRRRRRLAGADRRGHPADPARLVDLAC